MRLAHPASVAVPLLLLAACASQGKAVKPSTEVLDAQPSASTAPAQAAAPAPGTCSSDAACAAGEVCTDGRCVAAPACATTRVTFAFDSAQLEPTALEALRADAQCIQQRRSASVLVEGHCDERGTAAYNLALGARRAETVKGYLAGLGVTAAIETVSFGKELPAVQGDGEAAWSQNRRAELRLPGDTRSDGTVVAR
jgi:peptidoglycan-associated lipoprotein